MSDPSVQEDPWEEAMGNYPGSLFWRILWDMDWAHSLQGRTESLHHCLLSTNRRGAAAIPHSRAPGCAVFRAGRSPGLEPGHWVKAQKQARRQSGAGRRRYGLPGSCTQGRGVLPS